MQTPLWQFWTDLTVKALGSLATVLAVVIALFGPWLRYRISPPRLSIKLSKTEGMPATLYSLDSKTNTATYQTSGIWYHIQVDNETRWNPVTGVHIFLLSIEAPDASGDPKSIWDGYAALGWRHDPNPEPKVIGYRAECDLCYILRDPLEVRFSPLIKGQIPERFTEPFKKFVFTLQRKVSKQTRVSGA